MEIVTFGNNDPVPVEFTGLPLQVYRDDPYWIPLSPEKTLAPFTTSSACPRSGNFAVISSQCLISRKMPPASSATRMRMGSRTRASIPCAASAAQRVPRSAERDGAGRLGTSGARR